MPRNTSIRRAPMRKERRRSRARSCGSAMARQHRRIVRARNPRCVQKKPPGGRVRRTVSGYDWRLIKSERLQGWTIDGSGHRESLVLLVGPESGAGVGPDQAVDFVLI